MLKAYSAFSKQGKLSLNEDTYFVDPVLQIFILVDGFGGRANSEAAFIEARDSVKTFLEKASQDKNATLPYKVRSHNTMTGNLLLNAIIFANKNIIGKNKNLSINSRTGASIIVGKIEGSILTLASVGNLSCHRVFGKKVEEVIRPDCSCKINGDDNSHSPVRFLGSKDDIEPSISEFRVKQGDNFILSSVGVYTYLSNDDYISLIYQNASNERIITDIVNRAEISGSPYNMTGILLKF